MPAGIPNEKSALYFEDRCNVSVERRMFTCVNALNAVAVHSNKMLDAERGCPTLGCLSRTGGVDVQPRCQFERTPGCNRCDRHLWNNRFLLGRCLPLGNLDVGIQYAM